MNDRFDHLVTLYYEGILEPSEWEELRGLLKGDASYLREFCDQAEFEQELRDAAAERVGMDRGFSSVPKRWRWMGAVAAVGLFLGIGLMVFQGIRSSGPEILAGMRISPQGRILVSGPDLGRDSNQLAVGSTVRVAQGSVEIQFFEGVRCLLEAPGQLTLRHKGLVVLKDGRARFDVEEQARGFQVISGDLQLTDLGASFGVDASRVTPEVHVLSGLVIGESVHGDREETRVEGGQAMVLAGPGGMTPIPFDQQRFRSDLGRGIPALYLSFDGSLEESGECLGSIAFRDRVQLVMGGEHAPKQVTGRFGKGLEFDGKKTHARTNWAGIGGSRARTVSLWIKVAEGGLANPILGWGLESGEAKMSFFGLRLGQEGRLRMVSGRRWLEGRRIVDDGAWHHIVVVTGDYNKGAWPVTQIFIDGERELMTPQIPIDGKAAGLETFETLIHEPESEPLMIGRFKYEVNGASWHLESFSGVIDEVIVAEGILDASGVRALFEGRLEESGLDIGLTHER